MAKALDMVAMRDLQYSGLLQNQNAAHFGGV